MLLVVFFAAATAVGFVGLTLTDPARARGPHALPALGTATFILLLAVLGAALLWGPS